MRMISLVVLLGFAYVVAAAFNISALRAVLKELGCVNKQCALRDFVTMDLPCPLTNVSYNNGALACNSFGDVVHLVSYSSLC